jgi:hypothetical protein
MRSRGTGRDCSLVFKTYHGELAHKSLSKFEIGTLRDTELPEFARESQTAFYPTLKRVRFSGRDRYQLNDSCATISVIAARQVFPGDKAESKVERVDLAAVCADRGDGALVLVHLAGVSRSRSPLWLRGQFGTRLCVCNGESFRQRHLHTMTRCC